MAYCGWDKQSVCEFLFCFGSLLSRSQDVWVGDNQVSELMPDADVDLSSWEITLMLKCLSPVFSLNVSHIKVFDLVDCFTDRGAVYSFEAEDYGLLAEK